MPRMAQSAQVSRPPRMDGAEPILYKEGTHHMQNKCELAKDLFTEEEYEDDFDDYDRDYEPDINECGFDPYEGCYTYDC